jgi:hypothetical protein
MQGFDSYLQNLCYKRRKQVGHVKKKILEVDLNQVFHSHISGTLRLREEMTAKNATALAYSHEHRNPRSFLRLGAEVMCIYQYIRGFSSIP